MTVQEFAEITVRVIAAGGPETHIPTVLFPERDHVAALEGIPENVDVERASRTWAHEKAQGAEEYLIAFTIDQTHFKVVRHFGGGFEEGMFEVPDA